jgi:hypothetical protein
LPVDDRRRSSTQGLTWSLDLTAMDLLLHAYNFKYLHSMPLNLMALKECTQHAKGYKHELTPEECCGSITKYH